MKLNKMVFDDKKIEAAANKHIETEYARYNSGEVEEEMICLRGKDSFKAGAKWAINELMKNLWHPASEIPSAGKPLIVEYSITDTIKDYASLKRLNNSYVYWDWVSYFESANITRWLYIDDLLPKEGGNQ